MVVCRYYVAVWERILHRNFNAFILVDCSGLSFFFSFGFFVVFILLLYFCIFQCSSHPHYKRINNENWRLYVEKKRSIASLHWENETIITWMRKQFTPKFSINMTQYYFTSSSSFKFYSQCCRKKACACYFGFMRKNIFDIEKS